DKDGPGGVLSPIILKNKTTTMDISNQWSYNKLFELQLLVTLKNTETENSFFRNTDFKFYNISGEKLNFESLLLNYKSQLNLSTVVLLIISFVLASALIYFLRRRNNSELKKENKLSSEKTQEHIFIRSDRADHKIIINEIVSIEGKKDYVKIQLESKSYLVRKNLKTFLLGLPSSKFVRINKSVAINLEKISKIQKNIIFLNSRNYHVISKNYVSDINDLTLR
ncbi:MAG: LytR/AlgR family response regulator transcription factor, partial [Flavobacteriaceae bacterium]